MACSRVRATVLLGGIHKRHAFSCWQRTKTTALRSDATVATVGVDNSSDTSDKSPPVMTVYVAATKQHVGKTSASLALLSGLMKRYGKAGVGFMKPVGHQAVPVTMNDNVVRMVDKDAFLVKEYFGYDDMEWPYPDISPVMIPPGYTREYIDACYPEETDNDQDDNNASNHDHCAIITDAHRRIMMRLSPPSVILCEGTGHVGVGSIIDADNATVASWLATPNHPAAVVLVANGGLGRTLDELFLNIVACREKKLPIAGIIVNKVLLTKYEQTKHYLSKILKHKYQLPLLGCIPDRKFLGCPSLTDLEGLFPNSFLISGKEEYKKRHYTSKCSRFTARHLVDKLLTPLL
jgi:dethiobiotin synthetase